MEREIVFTKTALLRELKKRNACEDGVKWLKTWLKKREAKGKKFDAKLLWRYCFKSREGLDFAGWWYRKLVGSSVCRCSTCNPLSINDVRFPPLPAGYVLTKKGRRK